MSEELKIFIIFLIGLFSAYFGSFSSGGVSVLGVGLLTTMGITPQMASITYKLGKIGDVLGGIYIFHKSGNIPTRFLWIGGMVSIVGSFLGTYLIFAIPNWIIYAVSGTSMIILTIASLIKKVGFHANPHVSKRREYLYYCGLFCLNIFGNCFIAGSGVWYYFNNTFVIKLPALMAKGLATAMSVFWFIGSFIAILVRGQYDIPVAVSFGLGMFIGGYFGAKHIVKIGNHTLRNLLLFSIIIFAFYFLYLAYNSYQ
ncbi:MAG: sulfite exporter TauE/SafE family protein [Candidatus Gracilibacteria bacterium]|nr:sulfite exporter TauE/SafE family protein [Candidatus Gracilibacteria bacterium]